MNDREWQAIEAALTPLYGEATLDCDGYWVTLRMLPMNPFKNVVMVYVSGKDNGGRWIMEDCEERRRFLCPSRSKVWDKKARDSFKKIGRRSLQKMGIDPDAFYTVYSPWWTSFTRLRRHFETHNREVRLISPKKEAA